MCAYVPGPEILALLEGAGKGAATAMVKMSVEEVLRRLEGKDKVALLAWFSKRGIRDYKKMIAVELAQNPAIYTVFSDTELYEKYVVADEGDGLLILRSEAEPLLDRVKGDAGFFEFTALKDDLYKLFNTNVGLPVVVAVAAEGTPKKDSNPGYAIYMTEQKNQLIGHYSKIESSVFKLTKCEVKVKDFRLVVQNIIQDSNQLMQQTLPLCARMITESGISVFKMSGKDAADWSYALVYVMQRVSAQIDRLSAKWDVSVGPTYELLGKLMAKLASETNAVK